MDTEIKVKEEGDLSPELIGALQMREDIITFYKLGFLDAYIMCNDIKNITGKTTRGHNREQRLFERISDKCKEKFERRFERGIQKQIEKVREEQAK